METTAPFNEELIVQYLLGELTEEQRVEIEDHAFQDQQYMQNILAIESDLIDEYVRGEIPRDRLEKFDRHFLASEERLRKVEFARALATVASESLAAEVVRPLSAKTPGLRQSSRLAFLRGFSIRAFSPAAAFSLAAALVLVIGATWLIRDRLRLRAQVSQLHAQRQEQEARQRELEKQVADERTRADELAARVEQGRKEAAAPTTRRERQEPVAPASPATLVALSLLPGLSRASNAPPALVISPAVRTVRLRVGVDPEDDYRSFGVELRTLGGRRIWSRENLPAQATRVGRQIVLNLPASLFTDGRYELSLRGTNAEGTLDDIGYYYFEVLKK